MKESGIHVPESYFSRVFFKTVVGIFYSLIEPWIPSKKVKGPQRMPAISEPHSLKGKGREWTMVAADTVADCGWRYELANYGEYSGAPSTEGTYTCVKIMFSLMTRHRHLDGKFLIVGGAIAKFYRCCSHVCHCDQSSGRFYVGIQGVHGQNLDSTSWSKLPRQIA